MKIIYPELSYAKVLELSGLLTLYDRGEAIAAKLFDEICANQSHSLHELPQVNTNQATIWENKEHLSIRSVKLKDARKVFF